MKLIKSPNFKPRDNRIKFIVIHYTQVNLKETLNIFLNKESNLSSHYVIEPQGEVIQMVDTKNTAYHAGKSHWRGVDNLNSTSIGIEIVNDGNRDFLEPQINNLIKLLDNIRSQYEIQDINIVGHSDIAPLRKNDPGPLFPWKKLACYNHGIYVPKEELIKNSTSNNDLLKLLIEIGYSQLYLQENLAQVSIAFQQHFLQNYKTPYSKELINIVAENIIKKI